MAKKKSTKGKAPSRFQMQGAAKPAEGFSKAASRGTRDIDPYADSGEDAFHKNRDSILFEDDGSKDRDADELSSDNEVYGLNLPEDQSSDDDDEALAEDDEDDLLDEEDDEEPYTATSSAATPAEPRGRFAKVADPAQDLPSDASAASDEDEEEPAENSEDEEETWAPGSYHASRRAPGEADSSDDEALELEAEEAKRLQAKARGALGGEDYGLGDGDDSDGETVEKARKQARGRKLEEDEQESKKVDGAEEKKWTEEEAIAHLLKKSPETLALLDDFTATAERIKGVEKNLEIVRRGDEDGKEHPALAIMELEHQALATYLPTLAFYFSLLLSPSPSADLLTKVLARLSSLRQALATMEELDLTSAQYEDSDGDGEDEDVSDEEDGDGMMTASEIWDAGGQIPDDSDEEDDDEEHDSELDEDEDRRTLLEADEEDDDEDEIEMDDSMLGGLTDAELEELMGQMPADADADMFIKMVEEAQAKKNGAEPASAFDQEMDDYEMNEISAAPKSDGKKRKNKKSKEVVVPELAPLSSRKIASASSSSKPKPSINDDYLDPTSLSTTDASEKASARHSLRFHVSQVKQKAAKRESGHGRRIGGDDDLPRRSKENARREVLKRQEHGAIGDGKGEALDGGEWNEEDRRTARALKGQTGEQETEGEDYYDMVKQGREEGRAAKKAKYDGDRLEEKAANLDLAAGLTDGPRGASAQILRNKGLQPKRAKVNRNPRVKKRMAYDKAVKKVATMKSVYKGGDRSGYEGEKSGIGSKVVKSVRLGGQ